MHLATQDAHLLNLVLLLNPLLKSVIIVLKIEQKRLTSPGNVLRLNLIILQKLLN